MTTVLAISQLLMGKDLMCLASSAEFGGGGSGSKLQDRGKGSRFKQRGWRVKILLRFSLPKQVALAAFEYEQIS
jgi:hypothetical protein